MIQVPDAVASELHLRHGWSMLASVQDRLKEANIDFSELSPAHGDHQSAGDGHRVARHGIARDRDQGIGPVNNVIVFVKVSILVLLIALGLPLISSANWGGPFIPQSDEWFHFGWSGICRAAGVVFFAYIGFDAVSTTAQEAKNPQRDMPIGIIGSLIICTILYCLGSLVLTGVVQLQAVHVPDPVAVATDAMGMPWLSFYVKIGAIAGLSSVILVMLHEPAANLLRDVEGRASAADRRPRSTPIPHAIHHHDHHRDDRDDRGRAASALRRRRADVDRHAVRLRRGLGGRALSADHAAGRRAAVQGPGDLVHRIRWG